MIAGDVLRRMHSRTGAVFCLASAAAFGSLAVFGKLAYEAGVGVTTLLFVRFALAAPVLWLAAAVRGALPRAPRPVLARALALGAVGYALQAGLFFTALTRMDASVLSLILYGYPALVTGAAIFLRREPASRRRLAALVASSAGVGLVLLGAKGGGFDPLGAILGAAAALVYTVYILVSDAVAAELDALPTTALVATGAATTFGVAGALTGSLDAGFATDGWLWLGLIALVSTATAILLFLGGLSRVGPSTAAILSTVEPPVTVALAFLAFGEALGLLQLAGALVVLGAAVIVNLPAVASPAWQE